MKTQLILRLRYPFPCSVSPHAPLIENEVQKWIEEYTCLPETLLDRYRHSCFGGLGPRFFPQAGLNRLIPLSRFFLWIFAHDDFFGPWPPGGLRQISREALAILEGEPKEWTKLVVADQWTSINSTSRRKSYYPFFRTGKNRSGIAGRGKERRCWFEIFYPTGAVGSKWKPVFGKPGKRRTLQRHLSNVTLHRPQ